MIAARDPKTASREIADRVAAAARVRALGARLSDHEAREHAQATVDAWRSAVLAADLHLEPCAAQRASGGSFGCCPRQVPYIPTL